LTVNTAITLLDAINRASRTLGISAAASGAERQLAIDWYNEAVDQFLVETKMVWTPVSMTTTAGTGDYTLDTSIIAMKDLSYVPSGQQGWLMIPVDETEITQRRLLQSAVAMAPQRYALAGSNTLMVWPTPTSSLDTINGLYVAHAASAMSADAHSPDSAVYGGIPVEWHPTLLWYVFWQAAMLTNDIMSSAGQNYEAAWEKGLQRAKIRQTKKLGTRVAKARPGHRDKGWRNFASPGVDTGF
jgi:hypothetical protein